MIKERILEDPYSGSLRSFCSDIYGYFFLPRGCLIWFDFWVQVWFQTWNVLPQCRIFFFCFEDIVEKRLRTSFYRKIKFNRIQIIRKPTISKLFNGCWMLMVHSLRRKGNEGKSGKLWIMETHGSSRILDISKSKPSSWWWSVWTAQLCLVK